jgi:membrane fusion protein, multidrug efflux system
MKSKLLKIVSLFLLPLGSLFLASCAESEGNNEKEEEEVYTYVQIEEVSEQPYDDFISLRGVAKAYQKADLASEEGGKIKQFDMQKGSFVREGETILVIENAVLKATMDAAKAQYDMAETNFKMQEKIYQDKVSSEMQYLNSKYERDAAKANYELIKSRYEKSFIRAPFSGIIDQKFIEEGEIAPPGSPIISLVALDLIKIEAGVPENYVNQIKQGDKAIVAFQDLQDATYDEKISFVGSTISPDNRTFPVEILIRNQDRKIKPELSAIVKVMKEKVDGAVVIPEEVIVKTDFGYVVFVEKDGLAEMRNVEIISRNNNKAAIRSGLNEGDKLIIVGYQNLVNGEKIKVAN